MRHSATGRSTPAALRRPATFLLTLFLAGAPAFARDDDVTTLKLEAPGSKPPVNAKAAPRSRKRAAPVPQAAARTTIPMDFSGMARRGADLDGPKPAPPDADDRPVVVHDGLMPGARFSF